MPGPLNWLIDFDETLATSSLSWAEEFAFPRLIEQFELPNDESRLQQAMLLAQEQSRQDRDPFAIVRELFDTMAWPHHLEQILFDDVLANYQPQLFDDALPFLQHLKAANKRVFVISNNRRSRQLARLLQIEHYIDGIYTPHHYPDAQRKPHRSLWDIVCAAVPEVDVANSVHVGDDPWSDGRFAANCGIPCWLVDRKARFAERHEQGDYRWVRSLLDIPITA